MLCSAVLCCAMQFIYSHKYNTNSAEESSEMNGVLFRAYVYLIALAGV